jgi:hypothetical protein
MMLRRKGYSRRHAHRKAHRRGAEMAEDSEEKQNKVRLQFFAETG